MDVATIKKLSQVNKVPAPKGTGQINKSGKRGIKKADRIQALVTKLFPGLDDDEFQRISAGIMGGKGVSLSEGIADEVLAGVQALDADNQEKYAGLKNLAKQVEESKQRQGRGAAVLFYPQILPTTQDL